MNNTNSELSPNFFIVGAPKAGTTSLYHYLEAHPQVFMSSVKEPNYFSYQSSLNQNLYYNERGINNREEYISLFEKAGNKKAIGEASVSYLFYPEAAINLKNTFPKSRIIIMLRNPVERAISHYNMDYKLGYVDLTFENVIQKKNDSNLNKLYYQQFIELGLYYNQVKRYIELFGRENVLIIFFEDFKNDAPHEVKRIFEFLDVDSDFQTDTSAKYNTFKTPRNSLIRSIYRIKFLRVVLKKLFPQFISDLIKSIILTKNKKKLPDEATMKFLKQIYTPDIKQLEKLLNRDLNTWQ